MNKSQIDEILSKINKKASAMAKVRSVLPTRKSDENNNGVPDDEEEYIPVGVKGLISASQKLLAVNRGLDKPDERDSLLFKRVLTTDKLLSERIKLDSDRIKGSMLPLIARHKNLKAIGPFAFDSYMEKFLIGNPLSSPLEEINPLHLLEQSRRATQMGPGGIGTDNAITESMQAIRVDQFGFLSPIEGPECFDATTRVFTKRGWVYWSDVKDDELFACVVDDAWQFAPASRIIREQYEGELISIKHRYFSALLTPGHRILFSSSGKCKKFEEYNVKTAEQLYGRQISIPSWSPAYCGNESIKNIDTPFGSISVDDMGEFLGWFISSGSCGTFTSEEGDSHIVSINVASNNKNYERIKNLLERIGIKHSLGVNSISVHSKEFLQFIENWVPGCNSKSVKRVPEDVFEWPLAARRRIWESYMLGTGKCNRDVSVPAKSREASDDLERLVITFGNMSTIKSNTDTDHDVRLSQGFEVHILPKHWSRVNYSGVVYCATVPGGRLLCSRDGQIPFWSGNSEKIGIDVRAAWGSKIGSDGKPYQKFFNRRTGKYQWMSPEDLDGLTVKLPD